MDGVKQQIQARQVEALENKHIYKLKKIKREMRSELDRLRENTQAAVTKIKSGYNKEVMIEQNELEKKLTNIRKKNTILIKEENERYNKMLEESKLSHAQQIQELENSQQKEIEKKQRTHEDYINNFDAKFEAQKNQMG